MTNNELVEFWLESSDDDYKTMKDLQATKNNSWALFLGHLVIEKLVKALYAKTNPEKPHAPKTHNLIVLFDRCSIELDIEKASKIGVINTFNISARYDSYKKAFKEKATNEYTEEQIKNIEEIRLWIKQLLI